MPTFTSLIDKLCRPHPSIFKDPSQYETAFRRNKFTLLVELASLVCLAFYILITNRTPSPVQIGCFYVIIVVIIIFLIFCRSYPNVFKLLYFSVVFAFGPLFSYCYKESVFFNSVGVIILPTWVLVVTGSKKFFFIQLFVQNIYLHILYKHQMSLVLEDMSPEAYFKRLSNISTFAVLINAIFILAGEIALEKAHFKVMKAENRKIQLERQKTFILSFSHELRNLINSMIGNIRLTMLEAVPKKAEILLRNSEVCGEVLLHLVNNILDTGKVQVGELEINPVFSLVPEIWDKTWGICSQLIKNKGLSGQIRIQKKIPTMLKLDSYRLMQILLNLVGNSLKFTERGSVSIDIQWIEGESRVSEESFSPKPFSDEDDDAGVFEKMQAVAIFDDRYLVMGLDAKTTIQGKCPTSYTTDKVGILKVIVTDTGCGISQEMIPKLFKKFAQVHEDPSKRKLGTGLGLFITKELIQKMNGDIKVFSREKKGSAFVVCIPAEPEKKNTCTVGSV